MIQVRQLIMEVGGTPAMVRKLYFFYATRPVAWQQATTHPMPFKLWSGKKLQTLWWQDVGPSRGAE